MEKHIISIDGVIGFDVTASGVREQLKEANGKPLQVEISSPGGSVFEGLGIYNLIRDYKGEKETRLIGLAASMASYIALAGDRVVASDNAVYMIHNARGIVAGDHKDMRKMADIIERMTARLSEAYQRKTGKTKEEVKSMMDAETFLFGQEILDAGFADEIIQSENSESKTDAVAFARLRLEECSAKLKSEEKKEDLLKAAALLNPVAELPTKPQEEIKQQGEKRMKLQEFLDKNLEAKAEYDAAIAASAVKEEKNPLAFTVLESSVYPKAVKDIAVAYLKGEKKEETLEAVVAMADMQIEQKNSEAAEAQTEEIEETPGQATDPSPLENGVAKTPAGISALAAQTKAMMHPAQGKK